MAKGNWRDSIGRSLLGILEMEGVESFLRTATEALSVNPRGGYKLKAQFVGEICEIVLIGLTAKYLSVTNRKAKIFQSVVLKDLNNPKSDFRTELDAVLVTPYFLLTTECKSYAGAIRVTDNCTLNHKDMSADVFAQSKLHVDKLKLYAKQLVTPNQGLVNPPVFANVFVFSNASIEDRRTTIGKRSLTVTTASNIMGYYEEMFKRYNVPVYDYERACKIMQACSDSKKLHAQHAKYLGY